MIGHTSEKMESFTVVGASCDFLALIK